MEETSDRNAERGAVLRNRRGQLTDSEGSVVLVDVRGDPGPEVPFRDELTACLSIPVTYSIVEGLENFRPQRLRHQNLRAN